MTKDTPLLADERDDTLTMSMDNVLASRLGDAHHIAAKMSAGDKIDRGLGLCRALKEQGFGIVKLSRDHFFIGQHPKALRTAARTGGDALLREAAEGLRVLCGSKEAPRRIVDVDTGETVSELLARIDQALSHPTPADDARTPDDVVEALGEVKTNIAWAEEHYSGPEFFDVAWPEIRKSLDALNTALTASGDARERALRERMVGMMRSLADDHAVSIRDYSEEARTILALLDTPPAGDGGGV